MTDITCVFGTRPELVKLVGVVEALRAAGLSTVALATGQHMELLDSGLVARMHGAISLDIPNDGRLLRFVARARKALRAYLKANPTRAVLVQGDTMSALVGAQVAQEAGIPVAHVEAGVRSHDLDDPWPEELIRVAIDRIATWKFPATHAALYNLVQERRDDGATAPTGNTSIDALRRAGVTPRPEAAPVILVTLHRRELRQRANVTETMQALLNAAETHAISVVWPLHPAMHGALSGLRIPSNVHIRPPMTHAAMLGALAEARGVLTDSGGLVEEAATLGVPTAILRDANDRPEAVAAGIAQQFAPTPDGAKLALQTLAMRTLSERIPTNIYGDGHAAERIAAHLAQELAQRPAVAVT